MSEGSSRFDVIIGGDARGLGAMAATAVNEINRVHHAIRALPTQAVQRFGASLAGFFSIGYIERQVRGLMEWSEQIGRMSDRTGVALEKLQAWEYAGKTNAITLEAWGSALRRVGQFQEQLAKGSGQAASAGKALGITPSEARKMTKSEMFEAVWSGVYAAGEAGNTQISNAVMKALGRGMDKMIVVFKEQSPAMAFAQAQKDKIIVDSQTIASARAVKDAYERLEVQLSRGFLPLMDIIVKAMAAFAGAIVAFREQIEAKNKLASMGFTKEGMNREWKWYESFLMPFADKKTQAKYLQKPQSPEQILNGLVSDKMPEKQRLQLLGYITGRQTSMREGVADATVIERAMAAYESIMKARPSKGEEDRPDYDPVKIGRRGVGMGGDIAKIGGFIGGGAISQAMLMLNEQRNMVRAQEKTTRAVEGLKD